MKANDTAARELRRRMDEEKLARLRAFREHLVQILADDFDRGVEAAIDKADRAIARTQADLLQ